MNTTMQTEPLSNGLAGCLDAAKVGDGATWCGYSDRHAATIIKRTASKIWIQEDRATLLNGANSGAPDALKFSPGGFCGHTSGVQRYSYERDPNGAVRCFSRRELSDGRVRWVQVREGARTGTPLVAGRSHYYDFNF